MWLLLWRVATRGLGFISTLVLARLLVPADFGLVAMASAFIAAVDSLSQLGVQQALIRHPEDSSKLYDAAFTIQLGRAVITAILIVACAPWAAEWFHEPRLVAVLMVLAGTVVMGGFENIGIIEFRREIRFDIQFRLLLIPRVVQVLTTIPAALILHSYWALMVGVVCSKAAWIIMNYIAHPYRPKLRLTGWRHLAGFSFWIWATSLASLVWERCDPFVLGPHLGPAPVWVVICGSVTSSATPGSSSVRVTGNTRSPAMAWASAWVASVDRTRAATGRAARRSVMDMTIILKIGTELSACEGGAMGSDQDGRVSRLGAAQYLRLAGLIVVAIRNRHGSAQRGEQREQRRGEQNLELRRHRADRADRAIGAVRRGRCLAGRDIGRVGVADRLGQESGELLCRCHLRHGVPRHRHLHQQRKRCQHMAERGESPPKG